MRQCSGTAARQRSCRRSSGTSGASMRTGMPLAATGVDFADFLLGLPNIYTQGFSPAFYERSKYAGVFAQDSWRIRSNLTLNYGVRWDMIMPWTEQHDQTGTLIAGEQSVVFPTAPTGYVFPGDPGVPTTIAPNRYNNFSPRFGLA